MPSADISLRNVFDEDAELYDRARPDYPREVFDDIASYAGISRGSKVLEVACGTGQATLPLAQAGYEVTAVELGESLAKVARRKLQDHSNVRVDVTAFEDWVSNQPFDTVVCATAFHWIDPSTRIERVADALVRDGTFALIDTVHVVGGTTEFFEAVQDLYRKWDPAVPADFDPPKRTDPPEVRAELESSSLFGPVELRRHVREIGYSADTYIDVLRTYSAQRHLPEVSRHGLYEDIHRLIVDDFDNKVVKAYMTELRLTKRR